MTSPRDPQLLYELLFETATEGMIIVNQKGEIELANSRAGEMFGYSVEDLKRLNVDDLLPGHLRQVHEGYRKAYVQNPHKRPMGLGYDLVGVRKNGTTFPLEISLNHYRDGGETKVMALIMDITQRKEQEEQIRTLNRDLEKRVEQRTRELKESQQLYYLIARHFPNGTINVLDPAFNYIFAEGEELRRYNLSGGELVGKSYLGRLPGEVQPVMEERLTSVLNGKNLSFELEYRDQYYMINTVGLTDSTGSINRILLVEQNITERKLSEERTMEALRKEMHLNELKSRFVSMASHEFRTPLSAVLSSLSLIEKYDQGGMQDKKEKHYGRIRNSVQQLTGILNDFLSLEKVEAGKVQVSISAFDLRALCNDLIDQHTGIQSDRHIQLVYDGDSTVRSDQNMMRIVLSNLLSNALKYSGEGRNVTLRVAHRKEKVHLEIEDKGIGIPYEEQGHLFQRFFRAKNALNYEGTGLGLHIVSKYLQLLGGEISFRSIPGEGTTFIIDIPNERTDEKNTAHRG